MINDNDNTADVGKAKTDANALSDQAAGASHSKEAKVTNGATECKDQPFADCAVEINFNDVENDPEFEDPTIPRKYKYADRCALSSAGVIAGGSLYLINTENSTNTWQFQSTALVVALAIIFWIACGAYIKDLMHDDKVRAMKLFIAKKKAEQAAKDTCHS